MSADVIVVGGGVMGAATTWVLARRGHRVTLLERFEPGHARGSSHGTARIFRLGYEEADYLRLAHRALPGWRELEAISGATLLELTGTLDHGPADAVAPLMAAFAAAGVEHRVLDRDEAQARWPGVRFDEAVVHHSEAGRLYAQRTVDVLHQAARRLGAQLRFETPVAALRTEDLAVEVATARGEVLRAGTAVVTVGAWAAKLLDGVVALPRLRVTAEQPLMFRARERAPASFLPLIHRGSHVMYSFGVPGEGVKVAEHYRDEWLDPDDRPFDADPVAQDRVSAYIRSWLPALDPDPVSATRCLYTITPDRDFILDRHGRIVVGAGFSGHGFKFAPLIGELLADLAEGAEQTNPRFRFGADTRRADAGLV
ncbi:MAG: FAD-dependent oxidoreductase [Actinobacteria bacterium]|nr:FAD-dependent oxidoreductase [Actinomycetota bacterium]